MTWQDEFGKRGKVTNKCEEYVLDALDYAVGASADERPHMREACLSEWVKETAWEYLEEGNPYLDRDYQFWFPDEFDRYIGEAVDYVDMSLFTDVYGIECVLDSLYDQCETMQAIEDVTDNIGLYFACAIGKKLWRDGVAYDEEAFSMLVKECQESLDGLYDGGRGNEDFYKVADELEREYIAAVR